MAVRRTLRAIFSSAAMEKKYREKILALVDRMHRSVLWWVRAEYRENLSKIMATDASLINSDPALKSPAPSVVAVDASPAKNLSQEIHRLIRQWEDEFDEESEEIARWFVNHVDKYINTSTREAFKAAGLGDLMGVNFYTRSRHELAVLQSIIEENVSLIKSIPSQYLAEVEGLVQRSVQAGRDVAYLEDELLKRYDITARRARVIARDQNNKATQNLSRARMQNLGITEGIWIHSSAGKTHRETHVEMHNKPFNLDEGMYDDDPRVERNIFPAELVNCRCSWKPVLPNYGGGGEESEGKSES